MCGIAGAKGPKERIERTLTETRAMTHELRFRGPDGAGFGVFEGTALGHARLAIIDLSTGDQPQSNEDGSVVVVVNGEIYNYVELRAELEAQGHRFRTKSDIEVIPHLYDELGDDFVRRLRGMFAIALLDRRKDRLLLVRDRLGKKPLYHCRIDGVIYFASELKALLALPGATFRLDERAADDFFTWQYVPAPRTIFREVKKVPAGAFVEYAEGRERTVEYWDVKPRPLASMTEAEALEKIGSILDEATRIRMRSDVPLGAFLSGGIDSNLVVATAASMVPGPLRTTTISFGDVNASEVALARLTAERFKTDHREKHLSADIALSAERVWDYLDEPLGDSSTVPTYLVSKAAREDVTVALSGDGGDETFGGYAHRYRQNLFLDRIRKRVPNLLRRGVVAPIAALYPKLDNLPQRFRLKWGLENLSVSVEDAYCLDMSIFRPDDKAALYGPDFARALEGHDSFGHLRRRFAALPDADLLTRMLYVDLKTYLADGVLAKVDRMSMACSLEVRSPLLDQEMVEFAFSVPARLKLAEGKGKRVLRALADRRVGRDIARAPKMGFAPPIRDWLSGPLKPALADVLDSPHSGVFDLLDRGAVRRLAEEHWRGVRFHERPLWLVLSFETWRRRFAANRGASTCAF